ncbi:hypothetical protein [Streptomyces yangpuensis]|uniref:hypothetical protein n=1 Tax=Streptomyces yangpuensis TaxID=1648182 RepID=UPI0006998BAE|nr:hypothetical protein [Streptomyces yangpuensis]
MYPRLLTGDFTSALRAASPPRPKDGDITVGEDGVRRIVLIVTISVPLPAPSLEGLALYTEAQAKSWEVGRPLHPWVDAKYDSDAEQDSSSQPADVSDLALRVIANIARWRAMLESHVCQPSAGRHRCRCPKRDALSMINSFIASALLEVASSVCIPVPLVTRDALIAALVARNAAIEGDTDGVDAFSRDWLGFSHPERWRDAVEIALLGDWVDQLGAGTAHDPVITRLLQGHSKREHKQLQPLWERRTRGRRTALLSQPLSQTTTVADLLTEYRTPESEALWAELSDHRVTAVLRALSSEEGAVARRWAESGEAWSDAAVDAGMATSYGERVRRKLRRLGARQAERAAAVGCPNE